MKKRNIIFAVVIVIIAVFAIAVLPSAFKEKSPSPEAGKPEKTPVIVNQMEESKETVEEPELSEIPGLTEPEKPEEEEEEPPVCGLKLPYQVPDTPLTIEKISQYSGPFVEDGSDEPVANVAAMVVTNNSDTMVHFSELTFQVNDDETAVFRISTLPAGKSVLVLEYERRPFDPADTFVLSDKLYAELKEQSLLENKVKVYAADQELTVENLTEEDLGTVYVRYKAMARENLYMGGITYSCKMENVGAKESVTKETQHFAADVCKVLMVDTIQE